MALPNLAYARCGMRTVRISRPKVEIPPKGNEGEARIGTIRSTTLKCHADARESGNPGDCMNGVSAPASAVLCRAKLSRVAGVLSLGLFRVSVPEFVEYRLQGLDLAVVRNRMQ